MEERFETFTVLLARISRSVRRMKAAQMAKFNLKGPHVSCLYYLCKVGPMTAAELWKRCEEDKAAISRSLDSLEKMDYVSCECPDGKRYKALLRLTEAGEAVAGQIREEIDRILDAAGAGVEEQQREMMYRTLKTICANLEALTESEERK